MTASPTRPDPRPLATLFAARFTALIAELIGFIALRLGRHPRLASLTPRLCNRLNRAARIIATTMARIATGKRPRIDLRRNRIRPHRPRPNLPTAPGWLLRELKHEAALTRIRLESLLAEPGIADLLAQAPTIERLLAPFRRALAIGHEAPPLKPAPPPPPPQPEPAPARPPARPRARFIPFVRVL